MEIETATLIQTLMSLRKMRATDLAKKAKISKASLSKFLNGESDLRATSLVRISAILGANVDAIIKSEINKSIGQGNSESIGEDIRFLMEQAPPITRRTIADTVIDVFKSEKNLETKSRVTRIKKYRDSIRTVRRQSC